MVQSQPTTTLQEAFEVTGEKTRPGQCNAANLTSAQGVLPALVGESETKLVSQTVPAQTKVEVPYPTQ